MVETKSVINFYKELDYKKKLPTNT